MVIVFGRSGGGSELNLPSCAGGHFEIFPYVRLVFQSLPLLIIIAQFLNQENQFLHLNKNLWRNSPFAIIQEKHWGVKDQKSTITLNDANMQTIDVCYKPLSFITELDILHKFYKCLFL